jgi:hypothetical protein
MLPKLLLEDIISSDGEIANLLARREHGERWDGLTAQEMIATYNRWRALIDVDNEGHSNTRQHALIAEARSEWQRALWDAMLPEGKRVVSPTLNCP